MIPRRAGGLGVVLLLGLTTASCSATNSDAADRSAGVLTPPTTGVTATTTPMTVPECDNPTASYPPLDPLPDADALDDAVMRDIRKRGQLRVAVDENTDGLATRDPGSGDLVGLEIDLARQIARAIFPDGDPDSHLKFITVTTKEKTQYPHDKTVDLAISAISMTCERWQDVAFSSEYFRARHRFLVREDSGIRAATDLGGRRVCMTQGSTSIGVLETVTANLPTKPIPVLVDKRTDCLVSLQEGEADAYLGHDTFLVGMMDQDPTLRIVDEVEEQHYAIAINDRAIRFTQYVNGILQQLRDNEWLREQYEENLGDLYRNAGYPTLPAVPEAGETRPIP